MSLITEVVHNLKAIQNPHLPPALDNKMLEALVSLCALTQKWQSLFGC